MIGYLFTPVITHPIINTTMAAGLGFFPAQRFPKLGAALIFFGLIICQALAYALGDQYLFPESSIYMCAKHAPEYVFFRISVICGATLFLLTWLVNFAWINEVCPQANIFSGVVTFVGIAASLTQMLAAATIDTGKQNIKWVIQTQNGFAILTGAAMLLNTILLFMVRKWNKGVKKTTIQVKAILVGILAFLGYREYIIPEDMPQQRFIVEYGYVFIVLAYYWSMGNNYKKFIIDYELTA